MHSLNNLIMSLKYSFSIVTVALIFLISGCAAPYSASSGHSPITDDWTLTSTSLEGDVTEFGDAIPAPVFNDATMPCYVNSVWTFYDGGGGRYTIKSDSTTADHCINGVRNIAWEVLNLQKEHFLQLSRISALRGIIADKRITYIMEITYPRKNALTLKYPIFYHNKNGKIVFNFIRKR